MLSQEFINSLKPIAETTFVDKIDVYQGTHAPDGYGESSMTFPDAYKTPPDPPSFTFYGRLQAIQRVPGTPEIGKGEDVVGNFIIVMPVGTIVNLNCKFIVNNGFEYLPMNLYQDKTDAITNQIYCYRIEH